MAQVPDLSGVLLAGRYELLSVLGEGQFGRVYRAHDQRLRRDVAVKVIKPWWSDDAEWRARFEHETQTLARLNHAAIAQIYDSGEDEHGLFYVAELVTGPSLRAAMEERPLSADHAFRIGEEVCEAL